MESELHKTSFWNMQWKGMDTAKIIYYFQMITCIKKSYLLRIFKNCKASHLIVVSSLQMVTNRMVIVHTKCQKEKSKVSRYEQMVFFFSHVQKSWLHETAKVYKRAVKEQHQSLCLFSLYISLSLSTLTPTHAHKHTHTLFTMITLMYQYFIRTNFMIPVFIRD